MSKIKYKKYKINSHEMEIKKKRYEAPQIWSFYLKTAMAVNKDPVGRFVNFTRFQCQPNLATTPINVYELTNCFVLHISNYLSRFSFFCNLCISMLSF